MAGAPVAAGAPATLQNETRATIRLIARGGPENEFDRLRFLGSDGNRLRGGAVLLVPSLDGVGARRQVLQREAAASAGDLEVGALEHGDVALHPRVNVALHRDGHFLAGKALRNRRSAGGLGLIPLAVELGNRMDIVGGLVVVADFERLASLQPDHARAVHAALLVHGKRGLGRLKRTVAEALPNINDY